MGKIISVANQKGGVGKTTTTVNLAAAVGKLGKKVLLVDMDPQGNATSGVGINKRDVESSSYDLITQPNNAEKSVVNSEFKNLDVIPASMDLAGAEIEMVSMENRVMRLKDALDKIKGEYDFIFLDCPPSLGLITLNAFAASDSVLVPIQCEYYALEGLTQLMATVRQVKKTYNKDIDVEGVLLTMYDGRLNLTVQVVNEVKKYFPKKVFQTAIPRNVRLSEAPSFGQPVMYFDSSSKGAKSYMALAKEFLENNKNIGKEA